MVEAIHRIGHVIGERATAECVESLLVRAKALGVDYVQGFAAAILASIAGRPRREVPARCIRGRWR